MEKAAGGRRFSVRNPFCKQRIRGTAAWTRMTNRLSPMSLLDRFREAVFGLIMLSALSKATNERKSENAKRSTYQYYAYEPHQSEAVADCIEFIKKSAINEDHDHRDSTASSSIDAATEVVVPVPVM